MGKNPAQGGSQGTQRRLERARPEVPVVGPRETSEDFYRDEYPAAGRRPPAGCADKDACGHAFLLVPVP
jgi:hypothetical protein